MGRNWKRAQPQGPAPRQFFAWIGRNRRLAKDFERCSQLINLGSGRKWRHPWRNFHSVIIKREQDAEDLTQITFAKALMNVLRTR
jgi:hypothetical protein